MPVVVAVRFWLIGVTSRGVPELCPEPAVRRDQGREALKQDSPRSPKRAAMSAMPAGD